MQCRDAGLPGVVISLGVDSQAVRKAKRLKVVRGDLRAEFFVILDFDFAFSFAFS